MANPEHFKILAQGVKAWNKWRLGIQGMIPDLSGAKLAGADLNGADFRRADLSGADIRRAALLLANLTGANLHQTNLGWANLSLADLSDANLSGANLIAADLTKVNLSGANLDNADFTYSRVSGTVFGNTDLSAVKGLETVRNEGPSSIDIDTIYKSKGNIPDAFLRGAGVPEEFLTYMKSLVSKPVDYYKCFISHSSKDDAFAKQLYADLRAKNVLCWKFDENAKWGEPVWGEIDTAIRHYDKLVVICSQHSLQSPPVIREIERALQKEDREHKNVLFPVRIDDYLFDEWDHPRKADVVSKVIGDFRGSDNLATYSKAFPRFLEALNRPQQPSNK